VGGCVVIHTLCGQLEVFCLSLPSFQTPDSNEAAPSLRAGHRASLGFQLHFVDIFLEELAKIGGEDLPAETIHSLMTPFIAELARGDDNRLSQHIEERIFHHLVSLCDCSWQSLKSVF
jgi:hypothetical protein